MTIAYTRRNRWNKLRYAFSAKKKNLRGTYRCPRNVELKDREIGKDLGEGKKRAAGNKPGFETTSNRRAEKSIGRSANMPTSNWRRAKLTVFVRDPRRYSITRHYCCDRRLVIGFARTRARELLSARTALPFRIAHVAAAVV